ncbi:MAG: DUF4258 domain-containing protein [Anaerolineae bacterium]|nr:DUF4258 domain-containing protein [Anaerolineae bacterium]
MTTIKRIRLKIIQRQYYLSTHAEDEMLEDGLQRRDIEHAILKGRVEKRMTHDIRGTRYRIEGHVPDGRLLHVICRFHVSRDLLIITVYALTE